VNPDFWGMLTFRSLSILVLLALPGASVALDERPVIEGVAHYFPDADTLDIGNVRIRVQGIDAPESHERCIGANGTTWTCGDAATDYAREKYEGEWLVCRDLGERNRDRIVAQCLHRGKDIALDMVRAGVVLACPKFALRHEHALIYLDAEKEAAFAQAGLHAGPLNPRAGFCNLPGEGVTGVALRGAAPALSGCAIKGNVSGRGDRIYHVPGQRDYNKTVIRGPEERMFCSEPEAVAAGWRPAQR